MTFEWVHKPTDRYEAKITGPADGLPFFRWHVSYTYGIGHLEAFNFATTRKRAEAKARRRIRKWNAELDRRQSITITDRSDG